MINKLIVQVITAGTGYVLESDGILIIQVIALLDDR